MTKLFYSFILLFSSTITLAQSDIVITLKGDTLAGKAFISTNKGDAVQIITIKKGKEKIKFKAYEIKLLIKDGETFHPVKISNKYQLGLLVKEGYLSLYKIMDDEANSSASFSTLVLIKKDGTTLTVPNLAFKKYVRNFLNDCDVIVKGFANNAYKKSDLKKIVDAYNNCIAENTVEVNKRKVEVNNSPQEVEQIKVLITAIKKDGNLADLEVVIEMLDDLKDKLDEGRSVPAYLKTALQNSLKKNAIYSDSLAKILKE
ncbi:MAG: hypothetical protein L3J06_04290 [Cyclobacteriaceae bacterium]|nr:hypothetical protein [Cyclobacteriaceae bacterium]